MKTKLCDLLNIEYPIIQGAMAHITDGKFAAAVSNAGGLGVIQCGFDTPEYMREEIRTARSLTDKPFAVNLIMENNRIDEIADVCIEEGVKICTVSAGNPATIVPKLAEAGIKAIVLVPHARAAKKMEKLGAAAVICEGIEGGGHIGSMTTLPLVAQVVEAVDIPVIAAGGFANGRGLLAALALGCVGIQMGTIFLTSDECTVSDIYKQLIVDSKDNATVLSGIPGKKQVRCIKNPFTDGFWEKYYAGASEEELNDYCTGSIARAHNGDYQNGAFSAGMISPVITEVKPVAKIISDVMEEADAAYAELKRIYG